MLLLKKFSLQVCKIICFFYTMKISIYMTHMQTDSCSSALAWGWLDTNPEESRGTLSPFSQWDAQSWALLTSSSSSPSKEEPTWGCAVTGLSRALQPLC